MNGHEEFGRLWKTKDIGKLFLLVCGFACTAALLAAYIFTGTIAERGLQTLLDVPAKSLAEGWQDENGNTYTLPVKLVYPEDGSFTMRKILSEADVAQQDMSVLFAAKYMNVTLFLDGEEIGSCICKPEGFTKTIGKTFLITSLPDYAAGKELRIEAVPMLGDSLEYEINAPTIGTGERMVVDVILKELSLLTTFEAIFCFGILLLLFSWQARKTGNSTFFQVGLFALVFSVYSLSITDTIHLLLDNSMLIYLMEFLLLALSPLPLVVLVYHVCYPKFRTVLLVDIGVLSLNFCLQTAAYFLLNIELRDMVFITHIIMIFSVFILIPVLTLSSRQGGERLRLMVSFSPVLLGALWDIAQFYLPGTYQKAGGFQLGVLLFVFLQTTYLVRSYLKSDLYRKIAYTDALTGLQNRTAFEERIAQLNKTSSHYASVWCVCADVNGLKNANDTLGHSAGDELICGAAGVLQDVKSRDSDLYRTGGDEFVLFAYNQSEETMKNTRVRLETALLRYNQQHSVELTIAVGYDCLVKGDSITKLISRADTMMYEDKHRQKEEAKKTALQGC